MLSRQLRAIALRVSYHISKKLSHLHGQPIRTLVMMVSAFLTVREVVLSQMGRALGRLPGTLDGKVKRMSRFLCESRFEVTEAFLETARGIIETVAHAHPQRVIRIALDWTDLGNYMGLWLSLPFYGRAIPLVCMVLEKTQSEGNMTAVEDELLRRFLGLFSPEIRERLAILADRGFAKRELWDRIEGFKTHWAIRLPRDRQILLQGKWTELRDLGLSPGQTMSFRDIECIKEGSRRINLAIRRLRPGEAEDPDDDTWYIATDAQEILVSLTWYADRFKTEEMFRDLKDRLHMDQHHLGTEESVGKMMLIVALSYLVILEDGNQWRSRIDQSRIMKSTAWGKLSIYRIAEICFDLALPEAPEEVEEMILDRWVNRRAA